MFDTLHPASKVILALGGASYVSTGSDGAWKEKIEKLGHKVEEFTPALIPMTSDEKWVTELMGLSLKNVTLTVLYNGKKIYSDLGEMLFTHFGISGPLVLTASSMLKKPDFSKVRVQIDLKPGLSKEMLDKRILRDLKEAGNKNIKNTLVQLLPSRLITAVLEKANVNENKNANQLTQEERQSLVNTLKCLEVSVSGFRDINEAIVTRGGVNVKEIDPSTMESKLIKGLYFAGEMVDVDCLTGGFNIQLALSTGYLAGSSV